MDRYNTIMAKYHILLLISTPQNKIKIIILLFMMVGPIYIVQSVGSPIADPGVMSLILARSHILFSSPEPKALR